MASQHYTKSGIPYSYRRRKRPRYAPKSDSKMALVIAKKALALSKKTVRNMEIKQSTLVPANQTIQLAGAITPIGRLVVGDDFFNRDGQRITCTRIALNYVIGTGGNVNDTVRIILFYDKRQEDGVTPAILDVMDTDDPVSFLSEHNGSRFQILFDNLHLISGANTSKASASFRFSKKMSLDQRYYDTAAINISRNGFYHIVIGSNAANQPNLRLTSRIYFTDN